MTHAIEREFVGLASPTLPRAGAGGHPCQGVYHRPKGRRPKTAFIATHYSIDFSEHYLGEYMAARGYGFLGWNTRFRGAEGFFLLDHALADIGIGVDWLIQEAGVEEVVILGNSGGGSLMAAYQAQATDPHITPERGMRPVPEIQHLRPGSLYISLAAHMGRPDVLTDWMDPSVIDENDPASVDPALNMFNPDNAPPFSEDFIQRYRKGQAARNHRITAWTLDELERLEAQGIRDRLFVMQRVWADLRTMDPSIDPNERECPGCYIGDPKKANYGTRGIGSLNSIRGWLSMWSLSESQCRAEPHLGRIKVPSLVVQADGDAGVFPVDAQRIYDSLGSQSKELATDPGDHYFLGDPIYRENLADRLDEWVTRQTD